MAELWRPIKKAPELGRQSAPAIPATVSRPNLKRNEGPSPSGKSSPGDAFKRPDRWIENGRALQCGTGEGSAMLVRLGVDFGTAYTKLAIGLLDQVFVVNWAGLHDGPQKFLLSGELSELPDGSFVGRAAGASRHFDNLKSPFLSKAAVTDDQLIQAAMFLAWTFKYARAWLYRHHPKLVQHRKLIWEANLGIPAGTWAAVQSLDNTYRRIGAAAWYLSQCDNTLWKERAESAVRGPIKELTNGLDNLGLIPEFAAQVAGYLKSPQRRDEGIHLLVDVGAGTLDLACFRVRRAADRHTEILPVFSSSVEPLGANYLMQSRFDVSSLVAPSWRSGDIVPTVEMFCKTYGVGMEAIRRADAAFSKKVTRCVARVIGETKRRDRTAAEFRLDDGHRDLTVFMSGGGGRLATYLQGVDSAFRQCRVRYAARPLPRDSRINAGASLDDALATRVSVASGLTYPLDDLKMYAPREIPLVPTVQPRSRPTHEELYPK